MYTIRVSDGVDKVIAKWKKSNPNLFKKYKKIYKELLEHVPINVSSWFHKCAFMVFCKDTN